MSAGDDGLRPVPSGHCWQCGWDDGSAHLDLEGTTQCMRHADPRDPADLIGVKVWSAIGDVLGGTAPAPEMLARIRAAVEESVDLATRTRGGAR